MDVSEADRLTRDFAQHARKTNGRPNYHWDSDGVWATAVWTLSALFAAVVVSGVTVALA